MSKAKTSTKAPATNIKALQLSRTPDQTDAQATAAAAVMPSLNAAVVVDAFQRNIMGEDLNFNALIDGLRASSDKVKAGDLSTHGGHADWAGDGAANYFCQPGKTCCESRIPKAL